MTATAAHLRLAGIHIYKVRCIVTERKRGGKFEEVRRKELVIINNLDRAKDLYQSEKNEADTWTQYSKYSAIIELFEPKIHDNGDLAYFPENDVYIERFRTLDR